MQSNCCQEYLEISSIFSEFYMNDTGLTRETSSLMLVKFQLFFIVCNIRSTCDLGISSFDVLVGMVLCNFNRIAGHNRTVYLLDTCFQVHITDGKYLTTILMHPLEFWAIAESLLNKNLKRHCYVDSDIGF